MAVAPRLAFGKRAMVSSGHRLASVEALEVLEDGGNAVDAAVAGAAVLAVVLPYACGLGGDVYMLIRDGATGALHGLNGTGAAPARATLDGFADGIPRQGIRSVSVPGMVRGWEDALARFGTRRLGTLLAPAIRYADEGFPAHSAHLANTRSKAALLADDDVARSIFLPRGRPPGRGAPVRQPELAETLRSIAEGGARVFHEGAVARKIVACSDALGGLLSADDLARHDTLWQEPITAPFYEFTVATMAPNSWGPTLLLQLIALEAGGIRDVDPLAAEFVLGGLRARRAAYGAAAGSIGDPGGSESGAREVLRSAIADPTSLAAGGAPPTADPRDSDTSNVVVADAAGNAVSLIQSVSTPYGSGVVAAGTGVLLNNRMQGFDTDPKSVNCVGPGRRPAHTLAPAIVLRGSAFAMSLGTPGGAGQTCTLAQFLARVLGCGQAVGPAVEAARWSVDFSGRPIIEDCASPGLVVALRDAEATVEVRATGWTTFGSLKAVVRQDEGLTGIADGRRVADVAGA